MNTYDIGDTVRVSCTFEVDGVATNPTTVTVKIKAPLGAVTTKVYGTDAEVQRPSTGRFYIDVDATETGTYRYRWVGTGTAKGAEAGAFYVRKNEVG